MTIMQDNSTSEFKVLGMSMPTISVFYGIFLIIWGLLISNLSSSDSITSYFPSFLGGPLFLSGLLAIKNPEKRIEHIQAGYNSVVQRHTYFHRVAKIFSELGMQSEADKCMETMKQFFVEE